MQNPEKLSVPPSIHMVALLEEKHLCKAIARIFPDMERILTQTQLDITNENNAATVGANILGIKNVRDVLLLFKTKGDLLIKQEPKTD